MEPDHSAASNTKSDGSMVLCCQKIICDNLRKLGEYLAQINLKKKNVPWKFQEEEETIAVIEKYVMNIFKEREIKNN